MGQHHKIDEYTIEFDSVKESVLKLHQVNSKPGPVDSQCYFNNPPAIIAKRPGTPVRGIKQAKLQKSSSEIEFPMSLTKID